MDCSYWDSKDKRGIMDVYIEAEKENALVLLGQRGSAKVSGAPQSPLMQMLSLQNLLTLV